MSWEIEDAVGGENIIGNIDRTVTTENKYLKRGVKYIDNFCQSLRGLCESSQTLMMFFSDFHSALEDESLDALTKTASKNNNNNNNRCYGNTHKHININKQSITT